MTRKLILLASIAISMFALSAGTAAADDVVEIENPGMYQVEGELTFAIVAHVSPTTEVIVLRCENHWEAQVDADGAVNFHDVDIDPHAGQTGNCAGADDCNNAGWTGQIEELEPFDDTELHTTVCFSGTGSVLDGLAFPIECAINDSEIHCDYVIVPGAGTPTSPRFELQGELTIHPNEVGAPDFIHGG